MTEEPVTLFCRGPGCGLPLPAGAQRAIGICVWCVAASYRRLRAIPRPGYSTSRDHEPDLRREEGDAPPPLE